MLALLLEQTGAAAEPLTRRQKATQTLRESMDVCERTYAEFNALPAFEAEPVTVA